MEPAENHTSPWASDARGPQFSPLSRPVEVDVVVVGAGITGVTAALMLKRAGKRVALVDKGEVGSGDTGKTTSHLTVLVDEGYDAIRSHFGDAGARTALISHQAALDHMETWVREEKLDCEFARVPLYLFSEDDHGVKRVDKELRALQSLGAAAEWVDTVPLGVNVKAALRLPEQAQLHPLRYLWPLAQKVDGGGSYVFTNTRVKSVADGTPCKVSTDCGDIAAKDVILATYSPITRLLFHTKVFAYRSYALALRCGELPPRGLYYDTCEPYHYIRTQRMVSGEHMLIVGGADHKTGQKENTQACYAELERFARERFDVREIMHSWSGQILEPADGLPFIGANGADKHVHVATGFSGTGMTFGTLAGLLLCDRILGRENAWASVYDATRVKPIAQIKRLVTENIDVPVHMIGDRIAGETALDNIGRGEGGLVRDGLHVVAVFRDDAGACHSISPVCPHLGCYVKWNSSERSWDCPCHGSRFEARGKLINGPAVSDLRQLPGDLNGDEAPVEERDDRVPVELPVVLD